jgi:ABC-type Fe3+/spermidine/putrescine transport system ATPase subunit
MVRPEKVQIEKAAAGDKDGLNRLDALVSEVTYVGDSTMYVLDVAGQQLVVKQQNRSGIQTFQSGDRLSVAWSPWECAVLPRLAG